ncbi:alpha/beta fold hydrolase [Bacillus sp. FJAT-29814]|uniref:alpha/beta fold hydrolase n=1 Tax=Bacillus sp. FJAT-29814 TaxID=1729688 RepID=UPI00082DCEB5|nr:alpha/beta hydrolase [Bacillus sp. FJAT-29814]
MNRRIERYLVERLAIEYSIIGEGEPIFVMHGGHSNCHEEFGYQALVENGFMVITPSRPGYGGTSKAVGETLSKACLYYARLLDHLKLEKVHLLGISAGGASAIYFAAKYPERVGTLTLQSAVSKTWLTQKDKEYKAARLLFHPKVEKMTWMMISTMNNVFPGFIFKQMFPSFSKLKFSEAKGKINQSDVEAIRKMNNRQRSGFGFMIDLEQVNELTIKVLKAINCPTFIMHSKHDGSVRVEHAYHDHEHIPLSELCLLDSWGHLIWLGNSSSETDEKINRFLRSFSICRM